MGLSIGDDNRNGLDPTAGIRKDRYLEREDSVSSYGCRRASHRQRAVESPYK